MTEAFVKSFLNTLASQPVTYPDDYQAPPQRTLRRVPILPVRNRFLLLPDKRDSDVGSLQVDLPAPPEIKKESLTSSGVFPLLSI
jgi:hypothetical protein